MFKPDQISTRKCLVLGIYWLLCFEKEGNVRYAINSTKSTHGVGPMYVTVLLLHGAKEVWKTFERRNLHTWSKEMYSIRRSGSYLPCKHLVNKHPQRPPVHRSTMAFALATKDVSSRGSTCGQTTRERSWGMDNLPTSWSIISNTLQEKCFIIAVEAVVAGELLQRG